MLSKRLSIVFQNETLRLGDAVMRICLFFFSVFAISCANTDSANIKTSGFCAQYTATTTGASASISVHYTVGCGIGGSSIQLSSGDNVEVSVNGGTPTILTESQIIGIYTYSATVTAIAGDTVTITLNRVDEAAHTSSVTLPAAITIATPANSFTSSKGAVLNSTWNAVAGDSSSCSMNYSYNSAGGSTTGTLTIAAAANSCTYSGSQTSFIDAIGNVAVTLDAYKINSGTVSSAFEGGTFSGRFRDSVSGTLN